MENLAKVTGISDKPEPDGSHVIRIQEPNGDVREARITEDIAAPIVRILQVEMVKRAAQAAQNFSYPVLHIHRVDLAHAGQSAELMVSTEQMGSVVLEMSDGCLKMLEHEIRRLQNYRSPSASTH